MIRHDIRFQNVFFSPKTTGIQSRKPLKKKGCYPKYMYTPIYLDAHAFLSVKTSSLFEGWEEAGREVKEVLGGGV